jgi:hypothetical protein
VSAFKEALGLSDEEAAPVHIEVARRLFRQVGTWRAAVWVRVQGGGSTQGQG